MFVKREMRKDGSKSVSPQESEPQMPRCGHHILGVGDEHRICGNKRVGYR